MTISESHEQDKEEWRPVVGYEGYYEVSSLGRVRGVDRVTFSAGGYNYPIKSTILSGNIGSRGYEDVRLHKDGNRIGKLVHRLVAEAFHINPENKPYVNHKNGIKTDNRKDNLEWATPKENAQHAIDTGLTKVPKGESRGNAKLKNEDVVNICKLLDENMKQSEIASLYGVNPSVISSINAGNRWNYLTNRKGNVELNTGNKGANNTQAKAVRNCRGEVFGSTVEAAAKYGIKSRSSITDACKGRKKSAGKYLDTKTKIKWTYDN